MKKYLILTSLFLLAILPSVAQINQKKNAVYSKNAQDLSALCKLWGFLKYSHPSITKSDRDWDSDLIKFLPAYRATKTLTDRNDLLWSWMQALGTVNTFPQSTDSNKFTVKQRPDFKWMEQSGFNDKITGLLANLKNNHDPGNQNYIKFNGQDGIYLPSIVNEKSYRDSIYPSADYRLLAVFRYWNIIEYWYPYKHLLKNFGDSNLQDYLQQAIEVKDQKQYLLLVSKMVANIQDSHAIIASKDLDNLIGKWQMPITIKLLGKDAVITDIDNKSQIPPQVKIGDIVKKIGNITIESLVASRREYTSASNTASLARELSADLTRTNDSTVPISAIHSTGSAYTAMLKNKPYKKSENVIPALSVYQRDSSVFHINNKILYVNIGNLKRTQIGLISSALKSVKGIILDCRQYPKYNTSGDLIANLLLHGKKELAVFSSAKPGYPGTFILSKPMSIGSDTTAGYSGKVIILVNEETQSTGEFLAMSFKLATNSIILGSMTAGADGNVAPAFPLPGGIFTTITGLGVYYPNGNDVQRIGIVPDSIVNQSLNSIRSGKDDLLLKAISLVP
ncbi:S41 family peptidase [Pedobacter sandarakinus]|uniref:S41 family peptidase n=1 Tax=Pedobacter sandarakinus TaxID=353156 RepID=UPI0022453B50|nr:S41 family peptidase [Pedobacter sandarakinus]MCX2576126.1 S41 family peptidase [Pedobacter sandarakinus]